LHFDTNIVVKYALNSREMQSHRLHIINIESYQSQSPNYKYGKQYRTTLDEVKFC